MKIKGNLEETQTTREKKMSTDVNILGRIREDFATMKQEQCVTEKGTFGDQ